METFGIAFGAVIFIYLGVIYYESSKTPIANRGTNDEAVTECNTLCNQWDTRRRERCNAVAAEASARAGVNSLNIQFIAATIAAAVLWYACAHAGWPWLAIALGVAAALASAAALFIAGELASANIDAHNKNIEEQAARNTEMEAYSLLTQKCKDPNRVDACLLRPPPC